MSLPPETGPADTGVIHDIGYRGYAGPRLGRAYATRSLFTQSLRAAYGLGRSGKSKVLPFLVLGAVTVPAVLFVAIAIAMKRDELPVEFPGYLSSLSLVVSVFLASQAPVLLSRDLRYQTVPLYFSRPITRTDYVRAKFAAMVCAQLLLMAAPLLVLYAGALLGGMDFAHNTGQFLYGLAAAALYAVVPTSVALVIAAATPRRGFGVAAIMGYLAVSAAVATVAVGIGNPGTTGSDSAQWTSLISPTDLVESLVNELFGLGGGLDRRHAPGGLGLAVFALVAVAMVVGSYRLLLSRYKKV
ncbi:ABC-2 type transport system permease protein [Streptomyces sp. 1114.5]|uniref:ABC transporter permease n=1 Tax=unclassified Streptomyces TaxID=2593676 RepID=UPI000BD99A23|nr:MULTISPECIES: ABC transporter permease [unclassified Streptomyces]RKT16630.1 ABC-2 type transport system permease protein [Streptomyces sp. 1114.5]SOB82796.1 ABC-2 type transport system permease protein [Streptomyces sp. 1331.2]